MNEITEWQSAKNNNVASRPVSEIFFCCDLKNKEDYYTAPMDAVFSHFTASSIEDT